MSRPDTIAGVGGLFGWGGLGNGDAGLGRRFVRGLPIFPHIAGHVTAAVVAILIQPLFEILRILRPPFVVIAGISLPPFLVVLRVVLQPGLLLH